MADGGGLARNDATETAALTNAMLHSGEVLDLSDSLQPKSISTQPAALAIRLRWYSRRWLPPAA